MNAITPSLDFLCFSPSSPFTLYFIHLTHNTLFIHGMHCIKSSFASTRVFQLSSFFSKRSFINLHRFYFSILPSRHWIHSPPSYPIPHPPSLQRLDIESNLLPRSSDGSSLRSMVKRKFLTQSKPVLTAIHTPYSLRFLCKSPFMWTDKKPVKDWY